MNDSPCFDVRLSVLLVLLVGGCAQAPDPIPQTPLVRTLPRTTAAPAQVPGDPGLGPLVDLGGARMQIPKGWVPSAGESLHWENAGGGDDKRPSAANMNVIAGDPKGLDVTWEDYWASLTAEYRERTAGIQTITAHGRKDVGGYPTYYFRIERTEGGVRFVLLQYVVGTARFVYYVTFAARMDEFPSYEPLFQRSAESFAGK